MAETGDSEAPSAPSGRWRGRLWRVTAWVLVLAGLGTVVYNRWAKRHHRPVHPTLAVLPELEAAPRMELEPGALKGWNVLLISIDTTRADHLNCYGYPYSKTPTLNDLARHGVLYSRAYTPSPSTLPAHCSLMTGLYPLHHGVRANGTFRLAEEKTTLAEVLGAAGYVTGAAISAFVLDSRFGLDQGFGSYDDDLTVGMKYSPHMFRERAAELTNVPVTRWLREHGHERFFFWVHYFDPHAPYLPPEPYRTNYAQGLYEGEIDYVDEQIGKMLTVLDEIGIRDHTLVIVVSDHGEGLGQHGEQTHSLLVYDSTLHVPMIFSAPLPFPQGRVVHDQACLTDVMPTVLELLGIAGPAGVDGVSLLKRISDVRESICIETLCTMVLHGWAPLLGIRQSDHKFILAPVKELYDLRNDPLEETNVHDERSDIAARLYQELIRLAGTADPYLATAVEQDIEMDSQTRRNLESLGYVFSRKGKLAEPQSLPDPKEMVYHWERLQKAVNLKLAGRVKEAAAIIEECVQKVPRDVYARQNLADVHSLMGDLDKAMDTLRPALELHPEDTGLKVAMASLHVNKGQIAEAEQYYQEVLEAEPESPEALMGLAYVTHLRGRPDEAIATLERVVALDPGTAGPSAYNQIGLIHLRAGRIDQARQAYEASLRIDALNGSAHDGLANVFLAEDNHDEALKHLDAALRFNPLQLDALATMGGLHRERGAMEAAEAYCRRALDINPKFAIALNNLGLIYRQQDRLDEAEKAYRDAIEASPRLAIPHYNLAQLLLQKGEESEAGAEFLAAVRADPNDTRALVNLATYHYRRDQPAEAARWYRRAVALKPDYALAHKYLGLICASTDHPWASIYHLEQALNHNPDDAEADGLRQVLDKMRELAATRPADTAPAAIE